MAITLEALSCAGLCKVVRANCLDEVHTERFRNHRLFSLLRCPPPSSLSRQRRLAAKRNAKIK